MRLGFSILTWTFYLFAPVLARLNNITVDDVGSGIQYSPSALWSVGSNCKNCSASPDVTQISGGTWHDSTHQAGSDQAAFASLRFTGTAVYVYCIIAHSSVSPNGNSDMTFFLDGQQVGTFALAPTGQDTYDYNVPVYSNGSIPPGLHTVTIQNGRVGGPKSLMLLDYIVYTTGKPDSASTSPPSPSSPSSPSSGTPATTIIAAVVPSVIALFFAIGAILLCCTRRRKRHRHYDMPPSEGGSITGVDGRGWSPVALTSRAGTASAASAFDSTPETDPAILSAGVSSQLHPYAVRTPIATASEHDISSGTGWPSGLVSHGASSGKAGEAGMVLLSPAGLHTLPTSSTRTGASQAPHSHSSLSSDVPPAYDDISRDDGART